MQKKWIETWQKALTWWEPAHNENRCSLCKEHDNMAAHGDSSIKREVPLNEKATSFNRIVSYRCIHASIQLINAHQLIDAHQYDQCNVHSASATALHISQCASSQCASLQCASWWLSSRQSILTRGPSQCSVQVRTSIIKHHPSQLFAIWDGSNMWFRPHRTLTRASLHICLSCIIFGQPRAQWHGCSSQELKSIMQNTMLITEPTVVTRAPSAHTVVLPFSLEAEPLLMLSSSSSSSSMVPWSSSTVV